MGKSLFTGVTGVGRVAVGMGTSMTGVSISSKSSKKSSSESDSMAHSLSSSLGMISIVTLDEPTMKPGVVQRLGGW